MHLHGKEKPMPYAAAAPPNRQIGSPQTVPANVVEFVNRATNLKTGHLQLVPLPERQIRPPETKLSEATDSPPGEAFNSRKRMD